MSIRKGNSESRFYRTIKLRKQNKWPVQFKRPIPWQNLSVSCDFFLYPPSITKILQFIITQDFTKIYCRTISIDSSWRFGIWTLWKQRQRVNHQLCEWGENEYFLKESNKKKINTMSIIITDTRPDTIEYEDSPL